MGTRGIVGFRMNNKDYIPFNHWDSYPECLGEDVMEFIREYKDKLLVLEHKIDKLTLVPENQGNWAKYQHRRPMPDVPVSEYCSLEDKKGYDLYAIVDGGVMLDNSDFVNDSLFCEWGWIINLDTRTLEVYRGFQTERGKGRFSKWKRKPKNWQPQYQGDNYYFPISLVADIPFDKLPDKGKLEEYMENILHENDEEAEQEMEEEAKVS